MIYLDNQATTKMAEEVFAEMQPYFTEHYGNAGSKAHSFGFRANAAVALARERVADLIGAATSEIIFTSGATEANNLAIFGVAESLAASAVFATTKTEHSSVLEPFRKLEKRGASVVWLEVDEAGIVRADQLARPSLASPSFLSLHLANNEVGTIQPVAAVSRQLKQANPAALVHCDAVQAAGKMAIDVGELGVDLLSLSAHKMYGPKGIGALWLRRRPKIAVSPQIVGGGQEGGMRAGTVPVPLVVGFGKAAELCSQKLSQDREHLLSLVEAFVGRLRERSVEFSINGPADFEWRIPGNINIAFAGVVADALLLEVRDLALSTGSACSSSSGAPSHVLAALGHDAARLASSVRISFGRYNQVEESVAAADLLSSGVARLRVA